MTLYQPLGRPALGPGWWTLGRVTTGLMRLALLAQVAALAADVWGVMLMRQWGYDPARGSETALKAQESTARITALLGLGAGFVALVVYTIWVFQAHRSDRVESSWSHMGSQWAFFGWVVPILSLARPLTFLWDLQLGLGDGRRHPWRAAGWWWATFLVSIVVWRVADALAGATPHDPVQILHAYGTAETWYAVAHALLAVALVLAFLVTRDVRRMVEASPHGSRLPASAQPATA